MSTTSQDEYFDLYLAKFNKKGNLTKEMLMTLCQKQEGKCNITGEPLVFEKNNPQAPYLKNNLKKGLSWLPPYELVCMVFRPKRFKMQAIDRDTYYTTNRVYYSSEDDDANY